MQAEEQILEHVEEKPEAEVGVSQFVVHPTLKEQGLHPYHVQKVQALKYTDFPRRVIYCEWLLQQCRECPNFLNCILFTDEAEFTRNAIFSSHNTARSSILSCSYFCFNKQCGIVVARIVRKKVDDHEALPKIGSSTFNSFFLYFHITTVPDDVVTIIAYISQSPCIQLALKEIQATTLKTFFIYTKICEIKMTKFSYNPLCTYQCAQQNSSQSN